MANAEQLITKSKIVQQGVAALREAGDVRILARDTDGNPKSVPGEMRDTVLGWRLATAAQRHHVDMPEKFVHRLSKDGFPLFTDYIHYWKYVALAGWAAKAGANLSDSSNWHGRRAASLRNRIKPRATVFPEIVTALDIFHEKVTGQVVL